MFIESEQKLILAALKKHVIHNTTDNPLVITVGESLMMLIDACNKDKLPRKTQFKLKALYLEGVKDENDLAFINHFKKHFLKNKNFEVNAEPKVINKDATRRYFETHLSYNILKTEASELDLKKVKQFTHDLYQHLMQSLDQEPQKHTELKQRIQYILTGNMHSSLNKYQQEYAELIHSLKTHRYEDLPKGTCDILCEIARSTILGTLNTQHDQTMPADIYPNSIFAMSMDGRGRDVKRNNDNVRTHTKGIMQSTTPIPLGDIARRKEELPHGVSPFQRSSDQARFMLESQWSQQLFARQTQIFVNGISSTTLATLRNILMQKRRGRTSHEKYLREYMTTFAALMIYNSGGHSLFEIFEVFKFSQFSEITAETGTDKLIDQDQLMQDWILRKQKKNFNKAMTESIDYMHQLLKQRMVNAEIVSHRQNKSMSALSANRLSHTRSSHTFSEDFELTLHDAVLKLTPHAFDSFLSVLEQEPFWGSNLNGKNKFGFTPLMLAAQIGKLSHVKMLAEKGANLTHATPNHLTALELAIKNSHLPVVHYLMNFESITIKKEAHKKSQQLIKRVPALYYACRQDNLDILNTVLTHKNAKLTLGDKALAINTAATCDNTSATLFLLDTVLSDRRDQSKFEEKYLQNLLLIAANKGNARLVEKILEGHATYYEAKPEKYNQLFQIANKKGYAPTLHQLFKHAPHTLEKETLNETMLAALNRNQFDLAVLAIVYGADPEKINMRHEALPSFVKYLENMPKAKIQYFLGEVKEPFIRERSNNIKKTYENRTSGIWRALINALVNLLNYLPGINYDGYYQKTEAVSVFYNRFFKPEEPPMSAAGHDARSAHNNLGGA